MPEARAAQRNAEYYARLQPGRADYWRKMAAPRHRLKTLLALLGERPPRRLVDLGCGDGTLLEEIRRRHPASELCGVDLSPEQIRANALRAADVEWLAADLERPDSLGGVRREHFDAVIASELIEHLDNPPALLLSARALATPGARLLLSTQSGPVRATERHVGHHRHYEKREIEELLRGAGWLPLRVWNCGFPFHDLSKWLANLDPDASLRRFGEARYGPVENLACLGLRVLFQLNSQSRGAQLYALAERAA